MAFSQAYWIRRMERQLYQAEQLAFHYEVNLLSQFQIAKRDITKMLRELATSANGTIYSQAYLKQAFKLDLRTTSSVDLAKLFPDYQKVTVGNVSYLVKGEQSIKVTRQLLLDKQLDYSIKRLRDYETTKMGGVLSDVYAEAYYRTIYDFQTGIGYAFDFTVLDQNAIRVAVNTKWFESKNFSDRIWVNKAVMEKEVKNVIQQGIIRGEDIQKMVLDVEGRLNVGYSSAARLVRTETNHIYNQAAVDSYAEGGVDKYRFVATLDKRTSQICRELDGKVFDVDSARPGINEPPMHPYCRSTTIPEIPGNKLDKRAARDNSGKTITVPANTTYDKWYSTYVEERED